MAHVNVVVTQPGRNVWDFEHPWSSKLCSCCTNTPQCCFAFCCPCCFECRLFKRAGESMWTSLTPGARYALRSKMRTAFRIEISGIFMFVNLISLDYYTVACFGIWLSPSDSWNKSVDSMK
ncbi:unnamed protein product [Rotaria sp. Silwood2]|nr:unnamed protein product [Rotaria sp. Silwood2]CAF4553013.1 unnamed protein product [Rotaria sp. Silwood2]